MINKIESVVDAIAKVRNYHNPDSLAYQLRNPLLLRSFAKPGRHQIDSEGLRVFTSFLAGYKASCFDCSLKVSGNSRSGLKSTDPIEHLFRVYGLSEKSEHEKCLNFIRRALANDSITLKTPLTFFNEAI